MCFDVVPARRWIGLLALLATSGFAQPFQFPTANHALLEPNGGEKFFAGTVGKPWTSGQFGCVRSDGGQMHEGLDIRAVQRDRRGEPADPVLATADGTVAYVNTKPSRSNYGNYLVVRHQLEGLEIYSVYAHLHEVRAGLQAGQSVRAGEAIAVMGRTSNTRQGISKDRAHVHFELNLFVNDRFSGWYKVNFPNERDDHGKWNGQNLLGLDPRAILLEQARLGSKFSLLQYVRNQTELCRVLVPGANFPWVKRYAPLVRRNPVAEKEGVAGYEVSLNFNGVPFQLLPRAASELRGAAALRVLAVNEAEIRAHPCRHLVANKSGRWELTHHGHRLVELLTY